MRRVIIESPYSGDVRRNIRYARFCLIDCLRRGEAPFASHLLYTQVLSDMVPAERGDGFRAGFAWLDVAEAVVVYEDLGITPGMRAGITRAGKAGIAVEARRLPEAVMMLLDPDLDDTEPKT